MITDRRETCASRLCPVEDRLLRSEYRAPQEAATTLRSFVRRPPVGHRAACDRRCSMGADDAHLVPVWSGDDVTGIGAKRCVTPVVRAWLTARPVVAVVWETDRRLEGLSG
jgi:hypothetical protein